MEPATLLALLVAAALPATAEIRPSFYLPSCAWEATHVVVVTEGEQIDGKVTVLETWKGDVAPGETLDIPELAAFAAPDSRRVERALGDFRDPAVPYVSGQRMILFLKKSGAGAWEGANGGGMGVSTVWIEGSRPYAFIQVSNPGDAILVEDGESERELRRTFAEVADVRATFDRAVEIHDPAARAEALQPIAASDVILARREALEALRLCGRPALPVLQALLRDPKLAEMRSEIVNVVNTLTTKSRSSKVTPPAETRN